MFKQGKKKKKSNSGFTLQVIYLERQEEDKKGAAGVVMKITEDPEARGVSFSFFLPPSPS